MLQLAQHLGTTGDPVVRQELAALYARLTVASWNNQRVAATARAGQTAGPEGSLGKLSFTEGLRAINHVVGRLLGARLTADTGEWARSPGASCSPARPGYRIVAGWDEVQRNIIGERVLGMPVEPRVDRDVPWSEMMRA